MIEPVAAPPLFLLLLALFGILILVAVLTGILAGVLAAWIAPPRRDPEIVESPRSRDRAA